MNISHNTRTQSFLNDATGRTQSFLPKINKIFQFLFNRSKSFTACRRCSSQSVVNMLLNRVRRFQVTVTVSVRIRVTVEMPVSLWTGRMSVP